MKNYKIEYQYTLDNKYKKSNFIYITCEPIETCIDHILNIVYKNTGIDPEKIEYFDLQIIKF